MTDEMTDEKERTPARGAPMFYIALCAGAALMVFAAFREGSPLWASSMLIALAIFLVIPKGVVATLWKRLRG